MPASDDHDVGSFVGIELLDGFVKFQRMHFAGGRETLFGGVGGAIVGDDQIKTGIGCDPAKI